MLTRRKILLYLLDEIGGSSLRLKLTKYAFLLKQHGDSAVEKAFYDFLPYKYGPYSFTMAREINILVSQGYIDEPDEKTWQLSEAISDLSVGDISDDMKKDISFIKHHYRKANVDRLLGEVYSRWPWYTVNSKDPDKRKAIPAKAEPAVYTCGYQGMSIDSFLNSLLKRGISRIIDVRSNPVSRQYGYHKKTFSLLADYVGIEYLHYPQVGIPKHLRSDLNTKEDYEKLFDLYEAEVLPKQRSNICALADVMADKPSVLVCFEHDHEFCHRSRLAQAVAQKNNLDLINLKGSE